MKKGIVMEKHRRYTVIMTKEGAFLKSEPIKHADIGVEVRYQPLRSKKGMLLYVPSGKKLSIPILAIACLLICLILPVYTAPANSKTYAYVNVELNPSVELQVDKDLQVDAIRAINKDATRIVNTLTNYQGKKVESVIEMIIEQSEKSGLMENGKNMLVGVSYNVEETEERIEERIEQYFSSHEDNWNIAAFQVPVNVRKTAEKEERSMNEIMAESIFGKKQQLSAAKASGKEKLDDEERAIIHHFYPSVDHGHPANNPREEIPAKEKNSQPDPVQQPNNSQLKETELQVVKDKQPEVKKVQEKPGHKNKKANKDLHPSELMENNASQAKNNRGKGPFIKENPPVKEENNGHPGKGNGKAKPNDSGNKQNDKAKGKKGQEDKSKENHN
ncbi:anti-sigma factor domain-containing protein [Lentibacillus sediminis]|uniref:anti-sigma-I factor RsgI family protein n=1 Tax=Lentibacillus sediminis TaxID=1940529 RepID=UPI000C1C1115|nr:hypothetical protein [Lentibacillus sediminis]